jgi:signal transduction histidine kinase/ligand-binding sensor domain-containing protein
LGFGVFSNKIEAMQSTRTNQHFGFQAAIVLSALVLLLSALVIPSLKPAQAASVSYPVGQEDWPTVGTGAGTMRFDHFSIQEGLSDNTVLTVFQDSLGYLWFGTREGLNKYNGYEFIVYTADLNNPQSISGSTITALAETSDGVLWVGTQDGGLNRFDPKSQAFEQVNLFEGLDTDPVLAINTLVIDSQDHLWVGTRGGLIRLDLGDGSVNRFYHDPNDKESLSNDEVLSLFEDETGRLWVGTANGLNLHVHDGAFTRYLTGVSSGVSAVTSIKSEGEDHLWFGSFGGLIRFNKETGTYQVFRHNPNDRHSLSSNRISALLKDRSNRLWIGFEDQGVDLVTDFSEDSLRVESFEHQAFNPQSLSHNTVQAIFEDQGGLLWFGTRGGGVSKADPATRAFGHYQHEPGNPDSPAGDNITALAFDATRRSLWIGTGGDGLDRMDLITGKFVHYRHDPEENYSLDDDHITLLHIGPRGVLYVQTQAGELEYYDPAVNGFLPALSGLEGYRSVSRTTAITHDPEGMLWLSQTSGELLRVDPASDIIIRYDLEANATEPGKNIIVTDIYADPAGLLWLATASQGLVRFDLELGAFENLLGGVEGGGPSHNTLTNIHPGRGGVLWLGTEGGGLNKFNPSTGEFTYYTTEEGLPSNRVYGILEDTLGNLWLSTGNGLVRFDPLSESIQTFNAADGLQGNTFNPQAYAAGGSSSLFFGGVDGFNAFNPILIRSNDQPPPLVITEVSLFNEVLARDIIGCEALLDLPHDQNFLSFTFAALDFTAPEHNRYAYRMEGLDEDFIQAGNKRSADYPDLAWGEYTFRLIGSNNDGLWNREETCLSITIQPPFWAMWWFILLIGLFLAGAVILGYQLRTRAIEKNQRNLAVQVFERTMEIERRRQMASGLGEVIRLINTNQPLEKCLVFIAQQSVGLTSASKAAIFQRVEDQVIARACYPQGETYPVDLRNPESTSARCFLESTFLNRLLIYSRVDPETMQSDTRWELVSGEYRNILCTPVVVNDEVYGGLVLYYGEDRTFTPEEINLAHTLADQASLAIANERLKDEAQNAAVIAERNRLARDLHDAVTQTLFSASLIAEVLPKIWERDPEKAQARLDELRQLTRGALGEMRTLLMELRPLAMKDADPLDLFKHLMEAFTGRTGVAVDFSMSGADDCSLPEQVKLVFYRIVQEALNNIAKHADASRVWFRFDCDKDSATLTLTDDGRGFKRDLVPPGRLGLSIMQERAEGIGADLALVSQPGEGTTLRLAWRTNQDAIK